MKKSTYLIALALGASTITFAQNVGINTDGTDPDSDALLHVKDNNADSSVVRVENEQSKLTKFELRNPSAKWDLRIPTGATDLRINNGSGQDHVTIQNDGDVGIGTVAPTVTLDVDGDAIFNESGAAVDFRIEGDTEANLFFVDASADNIGIGTSSPSRLLHLDGTDANTTAGPHTWVTTSADATYPVFTQLNWSHDNISLAFDAYYDGSWRSSDAGSNFMISKHTDELNFYSESGIAAGSVVTWDVGLTLEDDGNVGIGTNSPTQKLHVVGNICYTGTSASCSDVRYKKDFDKIGSALDKISKIDGYTYNFRVDEFPENDFDSTRQVGFKAQEIQEVLPQVVLENDSGYLSIDYGKVTPLLLMAIKEQQAIIEAQKKEIETQKAENAAQEKEVEEVKAALDSKTSENAEASTNNAEEIEALKAQVQQLLQLIQQQESASVTD